MALIKSTILAQISGSINGTTFAHNQGGAYARNRSAVSNPNTGRQAQVRTAMTSLSKMWGASLTQAQRDEWVAYGGSLSVTNRLGDIISLSGIAAFNRLNLFRVGTLGLPTQLAPPGNPPAAPGETVPAYNDASLAALMGDLELTIDVTADMTNYGFVVWYSAPLSPGIRFYRGPYAGYLTFVDGSGTTATFSVGSSLGVVGDYRAVKITMYHKATALPIWTVYVDPEEITPAI